MGNVRDTECKSQREEVVEKLIVGIEGSTLMNTITAVETRLDAGVKVSTTRKTHSSPTSSTMNKSYTMMTF